MTSPPLAPTTYRNAFAIAFRDACKAKGWNQSETARRLGCVQSAVSRYWAGHFTPDIVVLRQAFTAQEIAAMLDDAEDLCPVPLPLPRIRKQRRRASHR